MIERLRRADIIVIEVRPDIEFRAAPIPGTVSMPLTGLSGRLGELSRQREIGAYCRGPSCVMTCKAR